MRSFLILPVSFFLVIVGSLDVAAQTDASNDPMNVGSRRERQDVPPTFQEMIVKKRLEEEKRDHEELLKRGDTALVLADELEASFEENQTLSSSDVKKLAELEKLVTRIRKELGGDDDDSPEEVIKEKPSGMGEAITFLKDSTTKLVDELKRTTRFSISAVAIQTSNSVIRVARFLRLKK